MVITSKLFVIDGYLKITDTVKNRRLVLRYSLTSDEQKEMQTQIYVQIGVTLNCLLRHVIAMVKEWPATMV